MSKKDDLLDKMITRLEKKRAAVVPRAKHEDIDAVDSKALQAAHARLEKRGGFPVEGTQTTENQQQARERARMRRRQLRRQRAEAERADGDKNSLIAPRVDPDSSETEADEYQQEEDDEK